MHTFITLNSNFTARDYESEETLPCGHKLRLRAIRPEDKEQLKAVLTHLSPQSRFFRFFTVKDSLSAKELVNFTEMDFRKHVGLLASIKAGDCYRTAGTARYIVCNDNSECAEVSFTIEEEYQGMGIGSILLKHLCKIARKQNLTCLVAYVLAENQKMLNVLRHSGLPIRESNGEQGVIEIELKLK